MARAMFQDLWNARSEIAQSEAVAMQAELKKLDRSIEQYVDRLVDAQSDTVVKAYEKRIQGIEEEKTLLREKIARCGRPAAGFNETFRTALSFLANPYNLWESERLKTASRSQNLCFRVHSNISAERDLEPR